MRSSSHPVEFISLHYGQLFRVAQHQIALKKYRNAQMSRHSQAGPGFFVRRVADFSPMQVGYGFLLLPASSLERPIVFRPPSLNPALTLALVDCHAGAR